VEDKQVVAYQRGVNEFIIPWEGMAWARPYKSENRRGPNPKVASEILAPGDVIWVRLNEEGVWRLAQVPVVEGALVSLNPRNGAIVALSGGLDFYRSKFNRVTQARRQPGSNFKPFIYSAALDAGFTAASQINDAPVVFDDPGLEAAWRPENYGRKFFGPTRLRKALEKSRNLVSIRLLRAVGVKRAMEYVQRFGFDTKRLPRNLSLALGSGAVSPLELVTGYAVFANGGFLVKPYFLERILDSRGEVVFITKPVEVCRECEKTGEELDADVSAGESIVSRPSLGSSKPARPAKRVVSPQNS
ncbi:MAG: peptidase, partial [Gammaproteobacteria bacterium]|nr:peptidase [Gammaproteobacteria bacterium]